MKRIILVSALALATTLHAGVGATTNWVAKYVADYVANAISNSTAQITATAKTSVSNNVASTEIVAGGYTFNTACEYGTVAGLIALNTTQTSAAFGVTNGVKWAWVAANTNYQNSAVGNIGVTTTNMTYRTYRTIEKDGGTYFTADGTNTIFEVQFLSLTATEAAKIKGN